MAVQFGWNPALKGLGAALSFGCHLGAENECHHRPHHSHGIPPFPTGTSLPVSLFLWTAKKLAEQREVVSFARLEELPAEAATDKQDETRHDAVVNTAMLKLAGITKDTPQPKNGSVEKDPQTGEPTGHLAETAQQAVFIKIPMYADEVWERALKRAMQKLTAWGVTACTDASANAPQFRVLTET